MRKIEFPQWPEVLNQAELSNRNQHSFEITIRWYLSHPLVLPGRQRTTVSGRRFTALAARALQRLAIRGKWLEESIRPMARVLSRRTTPVYANCHTDNKFGVRNCDSSRKCLPLPH
jgi:hypothetical protein